MSKIRSPGVYFEKVEDKTQPLALGPSGQAAFLGMTTRGPLHTPVRVTSYERFLEIFGAPLEQSYLAKSIQGYFSNGGAVCYVTRIAHTFRRGRSEIATKASQTLNDRNDTPTLMIEARDEGTWGNEVRVSVTTPPKPQVQTFITRDLSAGKRTALVRSGRGFLVGHICRVHDGEKERFVTLNRVDGKELSWTEPIDVDFKSSAPTYIEPVTFDVTAELPGYQERFTNLSFSPLSSRYFERYVNAESQLIRLHNLKSTSSFPESLPQDLKSGILEGGHDGILDISPYDFIGFNNGPDKRFGLGALETVDDVDLIVIPDLFAALEISMSAKRRGFRSYKDIQTVQQAMIDHCERLHTRIALIDPPPKAGYEEAMQWRLLYDSAHGAMYFPWLVTTEGGPRNRVLMPPSGYIAGIYARSDQEHGIQKPPANEDIRGVIDLNVLLNDKDLAYLNRAGINCIRDVPARGIRVWGARTLSSNTSWRYINVRRIVNALHHAIEQNTQWLVFEPNTPSLWKRIEMSVSYFLTDLWRKGFFQGDLPEDGFYVACNAATNPPEAIDAGILQCEIGVAPVRPAEFIVFRVNQTMEQRDEHNVP